jgi:hypothetical protein
VSAVLFDNSDREEERRGARRLFANVPRSLDCWRLLFPEVPLRLRYELAVYLADARPPGPFLRAVLENDLHAAMSNADDEALRSLRSLERLVCAHVPAVARGNEWNVYYWCSGDEEVSRVR